LDGIKEVKEEQEYEGTPDRNRKITIKEEVVFLTGENNHCTTAHASRKHEDCSGKIFRFYRRRINNNIEKK
jgi:hypothetical protein